MQRNARKDIRRLHLRWHLKPYLPMLVCLLYSPWPREHTPKIPVTSSVMFILGTGAKLFTIAGPVIAYGCSAAVVYGLIIYIFGLY